MTFTPKQWAEYRLPPSQWDNREFRAAISDIGELAAELAVYREAWEKWTEYSDTAGMTNAQSNKLWSEWKLADAAVRKLRGEG